MLVNLDLSRAVLVWSNLIMPRDNDAMDSTMAVQGDDSGYKSEDDEFKEEGDLLGDGGVMKEILKPGDGWMRPEKGDEVR